MRPFSRLPRILLQDEQPGVGKAVPETRPEPGTVTGYGDDGDLHNCIRLIQMHGPSRWPTGHLLETYTHDPSVTRVAGISIVIQQ